MIAGPITGLARYYFRNARLIIQPLEGVFTDFDGGLRSRRYRRIQPRSTFVAQPVDFLAPSGRRMQRLLALQLCWHFCWYSLNQHLGKTKRSLKKSSFIWGLPGPPFLERSKPWLPDARWWDISVR